MVYKTQGIIIKRRNFGEADRILTIYTEKYGKISAIAKGVRRPLSKLGGHLELFYLVDLMLAEGKNLDTVTGAMVLEDFAAIRQDLQKTIAAYHLAELIDKLTKEGGKDKAIFDLLLTTLKKLNIEYKPLLLRYFELNLLSDLGHRPEIKSCVVCRQKLEENNNFFSYNLGGVIHRTCLKPNDQAEPISVNFIKILRLMLGQQISVVDKIKISRETDEETRKVFNRFLENIIESELKSIKYLK